MILIIVVFRCTATSHTCTPYNRLIEDNCLVNSEISSWIPTQVEWSKVAFLIICRNQYMLPPIIVHDQPPWTPNSIFRSHDDKWECDRFHHNLCIMLSCHTFSEIIVCVCRSLFFWINFQIITRECFGGSLVGIN